jgi:hypothetical protein
MKPNLIYIQFVLLLLTQINISSCKRLGCLDPDAINYDSQANKEDNSCEYSTDSSFQLSLKFRHFFNNELFSFDSIYQDDFGNSIQFSRASFYFGKLNVKNSINNLVEMSEKYFLISPSETIYNYGTINNYNISSLDFTIGIDSVTNHLDPAIYQSDNDLSYQTPSMHWHMGINPQQWSYLFLVIEGKVDMNNNQVFDNGEDFVFHIGGDGFSLMINNLECTSDKLSTLNYEIKLNVNWKSIITNIDLSTDNFTHTMDNIVLSNKVIENANQFISAN